MRKRKIRLVEAAILFVLALMVVACWFSRVKISAYCFESAQRRYREIGKTPGKFDAAACDKYSGGMIFKYRAALFFNKRNYDAVWLLLDTILACEGSKAVLDEADRMSRKEPNDANYLLAIHLYQLVNGEEEKGFKTLERIESINEFFLADNNYCGELALWQLKFNNMDRAIASLEKCCSLAKSGHGDVKIACDKNYEDFAAAAFPFFGKRKKK